MEVGRAARLENSVVCDPRLINRGSYGECGSLWDDEIILGLNFKTKGSFKSAVSII